MKRSLSPYLLKDLTKKIVLLTGPRQVGKTTLAKMLIKNFDYLNFDNSDHRLIFLEKSWDRSKELIIFDELHKLKNWKSWLKGIYDTEKNPPKIIVTGSANLNTYKKIGDSLAGRFFQFRLHPLDLKEIYKFYPKSDPNKILDKLLATSNFPEPYLNGKTIFYNRWEKSHLDIIIKQDLLDLENVSSLPSLEILIELLRHRVGSPISFSSLARDLQVSDKTIKRWLTILENMYVIFKVTPFHKNIARALLKTPKYYFYDTGQVKGDLSLKLENLTACALKKEIDFKEDCYGEKKNLYYLKNKEGKEIDFFVTNEEKPQIMLEVKWASEELSPNFNFYQKLWPQIKKVQLVKELKREKTYPNKIEIRSASKWLKDFNL